MSPSARFRSFISCHFTLQSIPRKQVCQDAGFSDRVDRSIPTNLSSRPELLWASGPPKAMKNASVQQQLSEEPSPFPLSSRAKPRDLRFRGPFVEMFFDRAYPDFLPRSAGQGRVCGFRQGKPQEDRQRHQTQPEIRGVERPTVSFRFSTTLVMTLFHGQSYLHEGHGFSRAEIP